MKSNQRGNEHELPKEYLCATVWSRVRYNIHYADEVLNGWKMSLKLEAYAIDFPLGFFSFVNGKD